MNIVCTCANTKKPNWCDIHGLTCIALERVYESNERGYTGAEILAKCANLSAAEAKMFLMSLGIISKSGE